MTTVLGLDLSLTSTGVALADGADYTTLRIAPGKRRGHERLNWLLGQIAKQTNGTDLVVIEGPAYGAKGSAYHQLAGLWWLVTHALWRDHGNIAVGPPTAVKRYATGKGNAGKDDVLREVCRRFPAFGGGNDEADALVLAAMGADHLGVPLVTMPATHRAGLDAVDWAGHLAKEGT